MNHDFPSHVKPPPPSIKRIKKLFFRTILVSRFNNTCVWNKKVRSDVTYEEGVALKNGELIETRIKMYSIATGGIIEEDGVKYYEIYPELYNYDQACIINAAFQMMKICNGGTKLKYAL